MELVNKLLNFSNYLDLQFTKEECLKIFGSGEDGEYIWNKYWVYYSSSHIQCFYVNFSYFDQLKYKKFQHLLDNWILQKVDDLLKLRTK